MFYFVLFGGLRRTTRLLELEAHAGRSGARSRDSAAWCSAGFPSSGKIEPLLYIVEEEQDKKKPYVERCEAFFIFGY
ncbi:hypothetical protein CH366_15665 [Leptospira harrisiae]|nr:hypothetical protein CH366_15665 [Leptospira harrisiae]